MERHAERLPQRSNARANALLISWPTIISANNHCPAELASKKTYSPSSQSARSHAANRNLNFAIRVRSDDLTVSGNT
jgi:hypothetical protein